jgi:hypothetical protein
MGRTNQRLIAIENAGRDEIVIDQGDAVGLDPINPQQQAWRDLAAILGNNITQAYLVVDGQQQARLALTTRQRQQVETADARIQLATTILVVDEAGTYRALQEYRITNGKEQFLEIELPAGARLWTATVAGEPVKPAQATPPVTGVIRIPLVKTAEGEGDYAVQLKYGGQMPTAPSLGAVDFPLMKTRNINVEQSQVRLFLPESRHWFDFQGTLHLEDEAALQKGFQIYLNKRIEEASQLLTSGDDYTKVRAAVNLKQARGLLEGNRRSQASNNIKQLALGMHNYHDTHNYSDVTELESRNEALLNRADEQAQEQRAQQQAQIDDNRGRLNSYWMRQQGNVERSKNVVSEFGSNFDTDAAGQGQPPAKGDESAFNRAWLEQNKLRTKETAPGDDDKPGQSQREGGAEQMLGGKDGGSRFFRGEGKPMSGLEPSQDEASGNQKAPEIAGKMQREQLQQQLQGEADAQKKGDQSQSGEQAQKLERYQMRLEESVKEGERQPSADLDLRFGQEQFDGRSPTYGGFAAPGGGQGPAGAPGVNAAGGAVPGDPNAPPRANDMTPSPSTRVTAVTDNSQSMDDLAAGLASLDVTLPERGREYRFTTPRGEVEIRARSVSFVVLQKLAGLAAVLVAIAIVWALGREKARRAWRRVFASLAFAIGLIVLGLVSVFLGLFPFAGLLLLVIGIILAIRSRWSRPVVVAA